MSGASPAGLNVDSQGNVWITTRFGNGLMGKLHLADMDVRAKFGGVVPGMDYMTTTMSTQQGGTDHSGSVTLLRPDGTPYPGSPFTGGGLPGPWAVVVDGNDNVWISNFAMPDSPIVQLCGVRTETCPPGMKTGDQISPPGGYVGGGLQMQTDIAIDPAGNVWVMNNWQDIASCIGKPQEALSTRCGGQGVVIFYGMAKPVRAPQIGPAQALRVSVAHYGRGMGCISAPCARLVVLSVLSLLSFGAAAQSNAPSPPPVANSDDDATALAKKPGQTTAHRTSSMSSR